MFILPILSKVHIFAADVFLIVTGVAPELVAMRILARMSTYADIAAFILELPVKYNPSGVTQLGATSPSPVT